MVTNYSKKAMDIKQEFREEKNMDVYAMNVNDGSFSNVYVKWLEAKINYTRCCENVKENTKKTFGEIWSELTTEQSEYLKGYINRQRQDAVKHYKAEQLRLHNISKTK
jgi:hypothetical protein